MLSARSVPDPRTLAVRATLVLGGSALMWASAKVAVHVGPVPITLQTLAIPVLVLLLGRTLAVSAVVAYLAEGALGLPVFAGGTAATQFLGATAGYLWGFPVAAYFVGSLLDATPNTYAGRFLAILAGTAVVFAFGATWLIVALHLSFVAATMVGIVPFLIGDVAKCAIAAALPPQDARLRALLNR